MKRSSILKDLIEKRGTLMDFSKKVDMPYNTLRSILIRGVGNSSVNNVMKICGELGITIDELNKLANEESYKKTEIITIAAHHDGDEYTEEELKQIEEFKEFVISKRNKNK